MRPRIQFDLVSPERVLLSVEAEMVTIPGGDGYMGVMAGHLPLMTTLKPGLIDVWKDGKDERYFVGGGFADVSAARLTVLADEATPFAELSIEMLDQRIRNAEEILSAVTSESERDATRRRLDELRMVRSTL